MLRIAFIFGIMFVAALWVATWIVQAVAFVAICAMVAFVLAIALPLAVLRPRRAGVVREASPAAVRLAQVAMVRELAKGARPKPHAKYRSRHRHGRHHGIHMIRHALRGHGGHGHR